MTLKPLFAPTARAVDQGRSHDAKSAMSALLINNTRSIENQCTVEECHSFSFDQRAHGVLPRRGWTLRVLRNRGPAAAAGSLKRLQTFCQPGDCAVDRRCRPRVHGDDQKQQQWCTMRDDFTAHARRQSRVQHECSHECSHHTTHAAASVVREQFEIIVGRPNIKHAGPKKRLFGKKRTSTGSASCRVIRVYTHCIGGVNAATFPFHAFVSDVCRMENLRNSFTVKNQQRASFFFALSRGRSRQPRTGRKAWRTA